MRSKTTIVGTVGRDAELTITKSGQKVCKFSVAVRDGKNKTVWYEVTTWDKKAELDAQYVTKGKLVLVEGRLQSDESGKPRTYQAKDGTVKAANFELTGFEVVYLSRDNKNDEPAEQDPFASSGEDEIPF